MKISAFLQWDLYKQLTEIGQTTPKLGKLSVGHQDPMSWVFWNLLLSFESLELEVFPYLFEENFCTCWLGRQSIQAPKSLYALYSFQGYFHITFFCHNRAFLNLAQNWCCCLVPLLLPKLYPLLIPITFTFRN
jgi:hypothetical protein